MRGIDLSQFQFDYDLTWAALFLNADGTVYARYGSRSEAGPMSLNSMDGLLSTMGRVIEAHEQYPANQEEFQAKRGPQPEFARVEQIPAPSIRRALAATKAKESCIHCHNVYDGQHEVLIEAGSFNPRDQTKYPLPSKLGLDLDVDDGTRIVRVEPKSAADHAGLQAGDRVLRLDKQAILSIADFQFALHYLPTATSVECVVLRRDGEHTCLLPLPDGWRADNIAWRVSMYGMPPRPGLWVEALDEGQRRQREIAPGKMALRVRGLFGQAVQTANLKIEDVVVQLDGADDELTEGQFHARIRLEHFRPGAQMQLKVVRGKERLDVNVNFNRRQ